MTHTESLRLLSAHAHGRKQTRSAHEFYDRVLTAQGDAPDSLVAQAAASVLARLAAGAITEAKATTQLAALLGAWRSLR